MFGADKIGEGRIVQVGPILLKTMGLKTRRSTSMVKKAAYLLKGYALCLQETIFLKILVLT